MLKGPSGGRRKTKRGVSRRLEREVWWSTVDREERDLDELTLKPKDVAARVEGGVQAVSGSVSCERMYAW